MNVEYISTKFWLNQQTQTFRTFGWDINVTAFLLFFVFFCFLFFSNCGSRLQTVLFENGWTFNDASYCWNHSWNCFLLLGSIVCTENNDQYSQWPQVGAWRTKEGVLGISLEVLVLLLDVRKICFWLIPPIQPLSHIIPKKITRWIYGFYVSRGMFTDNFVQKLSLELRNRKKNERIFPTTFVMLYRLPKQSWNLFHALLLAFSIHLLFGVTHSTHWWNWGSSQWLGANVKNISNLMKGKKNGNREKKKG